MDRKDIFNAINGEIFGYEKTKLSGENVYFLNNEGDCNFTFGIRIQYFGDISTLGLAVNEVLNKSLNEEILSYIIEPLHYLIDQSYTIGIGLKEFDISPQLLEKFQGYEISNRENLEEYISILKKILMYNEKLFFEKSKNIIGIAEIMSKFSFSDRDQFSVGGNFPCQIMKKIIIFYLGSQKDHYLEYCSGLEGLFDLYAERKPDMKDQLLLFKAGYQYMKDKLEGGSLKIIPFS